MEEELSQLKSKSTLTCNELPQLNAQSSLSSNEIENVDDSLEVLNNIPNIVSEVSKTSDLPSFQLLHHLIQTYFNVTYSDNMIHQQSFESKLLLPFYHPDYPTSGLLHAMVASAARYSPQIEYVCFPKKKKSL